MTEKVSATLARSWWLALLENGIALLEDATHLVVAGSAGRAQALHVLAMEELAKALWIYETAQDAWTAGDPLVSLPGDLEKRALKHMPKLVTALQLDIQLESFWLPWLTSARPPEDPNVLVQMLGQYYADITSLARALNRAKKEGFYVDRHGDEIRKPWESFTAEEVTEHVQRTAQVALMLLIRDHSRMKELDAAADDSTHELQWRLLILGYPDEISEETRGV